MTEQYTFLEQAYLTHTCQEGDYYTALCVDTHGNHYVAKWDIIDEDCESEEFACDWDDFTVRAI